MGTRDDIEYTLHCLDCAQPQLCDCLECDEIRRVRVQAFVRSWVRNHPDNEHSGVHIAAQTVRPPAFRKAA